ncbi:MAG: non-ribosomal peptide synthetase, partial [Chloroflexi bacterium]
HESLRTTYKAVDGTPHQTILPEQPLPLLVHDLTECLEGEREAEAGTYIEAEATRPFDLENDLPIRTQLLKMGAEDHIFLISMHHIASDGWSLIIFYREMGLLYNAYQQEIDPDLPDLSIQYADYAIWQQEWFQSENLAAQVDYWTQHLSGDLTALDLPTDYHRAPVRTFRGESQSLFLPESVSTKLRNIFKQEDVTLFMVMLAAFKVMMHRYSHQDDIIIGSPIAGRNRPEVENLIGLFLNTLVMRTDMSEDPTFLEALRRVRQVCQDAFANQDVPFEKLLEVLKVERDLSRTPIFQVFFNMLNFVEDEPIKIHGLSGDFLSGGELGSKFDITLYINEGSAEIELTLVYNADLFSAKRMETMLAQYEAVLQQVCDNPNLPLSEYTLVHSDASAVLPDPTRPLSNDYLGPIHTALTRFGQETPGNTAVIDEHDTWTYQELNQRSNQLAHYLIENGVQQQDVVAIYGHRSASLVWSVMGALKAGAAFLILDPTYPSSRLVRYLEIAKPSGFVQIGAAGEVETAVFSTLNQINCTCRVTLPRLQSADDQTLLTDMPTTEPDISTQPDDLAYLSFTSGSTGIPKAVMGRHGSLTHFIPWQAETFSLSSSDRFSLLSGLAHDPLQRDIFTAIWLGATICVPDTRMIGSPGWLAEWLQTQEVTIAHLTPAMGQIITDATINPTMANYKVPSLRYTFFVGDVLTRRDVKRLTTLCPNLTVVNFYGSTETQRAVSYFIVDNDVETAVTVQPKEVIPLGQGMKDVQLVLQNEAGKLAGVGEMAEIYVRSPHLALGYRSDEVQTNKRFLPNPYGSQMDGDILYRTGDLGRYLPDGNVEFVHRADHQVKVRGFRVELGEIDAMLGQYTAVHQAITIATKDKTIGSTRLSSFIVLKPNQNASDSALRSYLREKFPLYMVPTDIVLLDALPLTPNGKINRRALQVPEQIHLETDGDFAKPRNEIETKLVAMWEELLGVNPVSVDDNFFEIGGHSLLVVRLFVRIDQEFGVNLPLTSLFKDGTIRHLAKLIYEQNEHTTWSSIVEIHPKADNPNPNFFCVHGVTGDVYWFEALARYMGEDQPFYGFQSRGLDGVQEPLGTIEKMAAHYIEEMCAFQPEGPYFIGGYSYGANIAYEMARQLTEAGREVGLLAILDHMPTKSDYFEVTWNWQFVRNLIRNLPYRLQDFLYMRPDELVVRLRKKSRQYRKGLKMRFSQSARKSIKFEVSDMIDGADEFPEHVQQVIELNYRALQKYYPQP